MKGISAIKFYCVIKQFLTKNHEKNIMGFAVLAIVGISAYFYFIQYKKIVDCGTDEKCFINNLKTCAPAKLYGDTLTIKGGSAKNCEIYNEHSGFSDLKKKVSMTCFIDVGDYEKFAKNTEMMLTDTMMPSGIINSYILSKLDICSGPAKDEIQGASEIFFEKPNPEELEQQEKFRKDINYISILEDQTQSKKMRYGAEKALCEVEIQKTEAFDSLLKVFSNKEEKEYNLRYNVAECFRKNKELRAVEALIYALNDSNRMIRFKAAQVLGEMKIQKAVAPLENILKNDSDKTVRTIAAHSLEMIKGNSYK